MLLQIERKGSFAPLKAPVIETLLRPKTILDEALSASSQRYQAHCRDPSQLWTNKKNRASKSAPKLVSACKVELYAVLRAELARTDRTVGRSTMQLSRAIRTASRGTRFARPAAMSSAAAKADGSEAFVGTKRRRARGAFETTDHATLMQASKARHDEDRST